MKETGKISVNSDNLSGATIENTELAPAKINDIIIKRWKVFNSFNNLLIALKNKSPSSAAIVINNIIGMINSRFAFRFINVR